MYNRYSIWVDCILGLWKYIIFMNMFQWSILIFSQWNISKLIQPIGQRQKCITTSFPRLSSWPPSVKRALLKGPIGRRSCHLKLLLFYTIQQESQQIHERTFCHAWEAKHELWCLLSSQSKSSMMFHLSQSACRHLVLVYGFAFLQPNLPIRENGRTTYSSVFTAFLLPHLKWLKPSYDKCQAVVLSYFNDCKGLACNRCLKIREIWIEY